MKPSKKNPKLVRVHRAVKWYIEERVKSGRAYTWIDCWVGYNFSRRAALDKYNLKRTLLGKDNVRLIKVVKEVWE